MVKALGHILIYEYSEFTISTGNISNSEVVLFSYKYMLSYYRPEA
jgi:hypothetical protein